MPLKTHDFYDACILLLLRLDVEYLHWNGTSNHVVNMQIVLKLYLHILYFDPKISKLREKRVESKNDEYAVCTHIGTRFGVRINCAK